MKTIAEIAAAEPGIAIGIEPPKLLLGLERGLVEQRMKVGKTAQNLVLRNGPVGVECDKQRVAPIKVLQPVHPVSYA
ncbi:hypothetical protein D3C71_2053360 [compost metagenome]